jgi:uncharacterized protein YejL (UPF0352 family)
MKPEDFPMAYQQQVAQLMIDINQLIEKRHVSQSVALLTVGFMTMRLIESFDRYQESSTAALVIAALDKFLGSGVQALEERELKQRSQSNAN